MPCIILRHIDLEVETYDGTETKIKYRIQNVPRGIRSWYIKYILCGGIQPCTTFSIEEIMGDASFTFQGFHYTFTEINNQLPWARPEGIGENRNIWLSNNNDRLSDNNPNFDTVSEFCNLFIGRMELKSDTLTLIINGADRNFSGRAGRVSQIILEYH